jgi:hypothetical protein
VLVLVGGEGALSLTSRVSHGLSSLTSGNVTSAFLIPSSRHHAYCHGRYSLLRVV